MGYYAQFNKNNLLKNDLLNVPIGLIILSTFAKYLFSFATKCQLDLRKDIYTTFLE